MVIIWGLPYSPFAKGIISNVILPKVIVFSKNTNWFIFVWFPDNKYELFILLVAVAVQVKVVLGVSLVTVISVYVPWQIEGVNETVIVGGTNELLLEKIKLVNKITEKRIMFFFICLCFACQK